MEASPGRVEDGAVREGGGIGSDGSAPDDLDGTGDDGSAHQRPRPRRTPLVLLGVLGGVAVPVVVAARWARSARTVIVVASVLGGTLLVPLVLVALSVLPG